MRSGGSVEFLSPAGEDPVDGGGADDRLGGQGKPLGGEDEGPGLRAAETTVEGDQLLEGTALVEFGVVEAADHDVGHVVEAVGSQNVLGRGRRVVGQRV